MSELNIASTQLGFVPGDIVGGKYRIDGVLGSGGMGIVLSATHLELDAPVAIKVVRDELATNEEIVSRLLFEARAAARMRSAHIVRVLDVARLSSGAPYIVLEQLQGADLAVALSERGTLSAAEAVSYLLQACEGLAEAHGLGIIHRDLKPENLFLASTPEGVVLKILDFGISKDIGAALHGAHSTLTNAGGAVGSPFYMSPEQMRAAPNLDARADIWSLGAILFELLTGRCPFEADTHALLCAKVMVEEPPSLSGCSVATPDLDRIVQRCLQKDPAARFQTVTELADALRALGARKSEVLPEQMTTSSAVSAGKAARAPDGKRRTGAAQSRAGLALFAVCSLLVGAGAGFWHFHSGEGPMGLITTRASAAELPRQTTVREVEPVAQLARPEANLTRTANVLMQTTSGRVDPALISARSSPTPTPRRAPISKAPARPVFIDAPRPTAASAATSVGRSTPPQAESPPPRSAAPAPRTAAAPPQTAPLTRSSDANNPAERYGL